MNICQSFLIEMQEAAAIATSELLDLKDPPTCILYPDDFSALGGINEIHERGLRIPDDISIAGLSADVLCIAILDVHG